MKKIAQIGPNIAQNGALNIARRNFLSKFGNFKTNRSPNQELV
jgi:hypothetical protein